MRYFCLLVLLVALGACGRSTPEQPQPAPQAAQAQFDLGPVRVKWHDADAEQADDQALLDATVEVVRRLQLHGHGDMAERLEALRAKGDCKGIRLEIRGLTYCMSAFAEKGKTARSE
jgi:hypothetical protein